MSKQKIGIFDSGLGGLTILDPLQSQFPYHTFCYYGDTKHAPWGDKTEKELQSIIDPIIQFLIQNGVTCMVIGCNTSTAMFYEDIKKQLAPIPVINLIEEACKDALSKSKTKRIAILATTGTVLKQSYRNTLKHLDPQVDVLEIACPDLVPMIEQNTHLSDHAYQVTSSYLSRVKSFDADTLIFGCSHYPFLTPHIIKDLPAITLIDPGISLLPLLNDCLDHSLPKTIVTPPRTEFWVSGDRHHFKSFLDRHFCLSHYSLNQINLDTTSPTLQTHGDFPSPFSVKSL